MVNMSNDERIRIAVRVYVDNVLASHELFERTMKGFDRLLPELAEKHATLSAQHPTMIEIEFLDEPDVERRFYRIGSDPRRMLLPIEIKREGEPN
jgi:hypothetical protein